jgi:hypothetical protein
MTSGVRKCATCGEAFGCDGPDDEDVKYYCSEECERIALTDEDDPS